tara:strand:- start:8361 stop:8990 length:630 start_codon:yes stop_codon:yes gene_type:complete
MTINYDQLSEINKTLANFPNAKLQIVTKNRDFKIVKELIDKGYHLFGENKVQEAQDKFKNIIDPNLELHLIGPLQTNKAKAALQLFDCIQSIDRAKLVNEIAKSRTKIASKTKTFFIQINIGRETQKSGVLPEDLENLYNLCVEKKLKVSGLMCIPPLEKPSKEYFQEMRHIRNNLNRKLILSMGMSDDYKISLECDSNLIRIGSRIFN